MATMYRAIMAKSQPKAVFSSGLLLLLSASLLPTMMTVPGNAQTTAGGSTSSLPTAGPASSSVKTQPTSQGQGPVVVPKDISALRIAPGDLLNVSVYDAPEFTNAYRVDPAGDLTIPLCGKVNLLGLTLPEAAKRLEAALKDGQILLQPQVNVDVAQYAGQFVTVMGEVVTPGRVPLIAPTMLGEILAEAGGVTPMAGARIKIRHGASDAAPEEEVPYSRSQSYPGGSLHSRAPRRLGHRSARRHCLYSGRGQPSRRICDAGRR